MPRLHAKVNARRNGRMKTNRQNPLSSDDIRAFIRGRLPLAPVPALPHILLHQAAPSSRLGQIAEDGSPYWAYVWPGGLALAQHILANPHLVKGRKVLDLGAGSGLVAIAAAKAGAADVTAIDIDPRAVVAAELNAKANWVSLEIRCLDLLDIEPLDVDLVTAGDLFYDRLLAERAFACLTRYQARGTQVLIGDPGRAFLPAPNLARVAAYSARDFGAAAPIGNIESGVYTLR